MTTDLEKEREAHGIFVPMAIINEMAEIGIETEHDDNGPGRIYCAACGAYTRMIWQTGSRDEDRELANLAHSSNCPAQFARAALAAPAAPQEPEGYTDGGRNMFFDGLFDGETERQRDARLRWADDMRAAFERHTGNGWFDKDWQRETALWAAAWRAATAPQAGEDAQPFAWAIDYKDGRRVFTDDEAFVTSCINQSIREQRGDKVTRLFDTPQPAGRDAREVPDET